jgi:hypothetical protein
MLHGFFEVMLLLLLKSEEFTLKIYSDIFESCIFLLIMHIKTPLYLT